MTARAAAALLVVMAGAAGVGQGAAAAARAESGPAGATVWQEAAGPASGSSQPHEAAGPAGSSPQPHEPAGVPQDDPPQPAVSGLRTLRDGNLFFYHAPAAARLAGRLRAALRAQPPLPGLPPNALDTGEPVHILLAPNAAAFDTLTGARAPEWGAGVAFPASGVIVLPAYESERGATHGLARVARHELAHVALHRYLHPARAPRWFDEGYARLAAGEWDAEAVWMLRLAFALHRAPPLDSLSLDWPGRTTDARVAYLISTSAVAYLVQHGGGERGLRLFLERWRESGDIDRALRRTYGLTLAQFEEDWRRDVRGRFGWALFLVDSIVLWTVAALLLIVIRFRRRGWEQAKLDRLRATEPPESPAFWVDEEEAAITEAESPPADVDRPDEDR